MKKRQSRSDKSLTTDMLKHRRGLVASLACVVLVMVFFGVLFLKQRTSAADGSGTNTVSPSSVSAGTTGNSPVFTFTAAETMNSGAVRIAVPADWSAPQGVAGVSGYTTATSAAGTVGTVLNALDGSAGWSSSGLHMTLSVDTSDKQAGSGSLLNAIGGMAAANEQWYYNYGGATNWGASNGGGNLRVGMWLKSSIATASGDFSWQDDDSASLASPLDTVAIPALSANTWTYASVALAATTRGANLSYGYRYTNDIGALDLKTDALSVLFDTTDATTNWGGSSSDVIVSLQTAAGDYKEGTGAIRCSFATKAGVNVKCRRTASSASDFTVGPGTTISFWVRSSVALDAGDFQWMDDDTTSLSSPEDTVNLPAISANTWTFITLTAANSANKTFRSYGFNQVVDKGAFTLDIDALGKQIDAADATTGWTAPAGDSMTLSADTATLHEGSASLRSVIPAATLPGDNWHEVLGVAQDWSAYTKIGFWIRSTVATATGDLRFQYSAASDLSSPIASLDIGALSANTWTYQALTLSGTRTSVGSYGIDYANDIGATTVNLDDVMIGPGVPAFPGGGIINVRLLQLAAGQTVSINYGAGGGTSGATAPTTAGASTFTTQTRATDAGSFQAIAVSPTITVLPGSTSQFLLNDPGDMTAGTRLGYTVTRNDQFGNLVTAGNQTVYLYSNSTGTKAFYAAASGGSAITSIVIADGSSEASFWYYDEKANVPTVTVSDSASGPDGTTGINDASRSPVVSPAAAAQFLLDDPGNMTAGTRIGYAVTRQDAFGNLTDIGSNRAYLYSDSTGAKTFYDAASGGNTLTSVLIGSGESSALFWYADDTAGAWTITASDNASAPDGAAGIADGTDPITVATLPTVATRLVIIDPVDGIAGDDISVVIRAEDDLGNIDTTVEGSVTLVVSGSATGGGSTTIHNGVGAKIIHDTAAETVHLSLLDSGDTHLNVSSTQDVAFAAGATSQFSLNDPGDTIAGTRLAYTVTRKDQFGNPVVTGSELSWLYSTSASALFYDAPSGGSQTTSVSFDENSSTAVFWYADEQAGNATVNVSDNHTAPDGAAGIDDATDDVAVAAGSVSQYLLSDPGNMSVNTRLGYTVTRKDVFGNLVTSGSNTVYLFSNSTGPKSFYNAASGGSQITSTNITDGHSSSAFWYFDAANGAWIVNASDNASAPDGTAGIDDAEDAVSVSPYAIAATRFAIVDPSDGAIGGTITVTVRAEDNLGNIDTTYQGTVTLVLSGSATGGGVVNVINGVGSREVSDTVAQTVHLTLLDTGLTGLNVSSSQDVEFSAVTAGGGLGGGIPVPASEAVIQFEGFAYPGAKAVLTSKTAAGSITLAQIAVSDPSGHFILTYGGPLEKVDSYGISFTDAHGLVTPVISFPSTIVGGASQTVLAPPTTNLLRAAVLRGTPFSLFGSATPGNRVEVSVDGGKDVQTVLADTKGTYKISLDTLNLDYGPHVFTAHQVAASGTVSAFGAARPALVSRSLNVKTDLTNDGVVNINDWSMFLVRWKSLDEATRKTLDFNGDEVVDISDFSIFIQTIRTVTI